MRLLTVCGCCHPKKFSSGAFGAACFTTPDMTRNSIELAVKIFLVCLIAVFGWAFLGLMREIGWI